MANLTPLQKGLARVKRFRTNVRVGSGLSLFLAILLWGFLAMFVLDVIMQMGRLERIVTMVLVAVAGMWAFLRYVRPEMGVEESDLETAMLVERQHAIKSDLVAAMQFSDSGKPQFGSDNLREATIDHTSKLAPKLNYLEGFSRQSLLKRIGILFLSIALLLGPMFAFPAYGKTFLKRLLLSNEHYPTKTQIVSIDSPSDRAPFGQPVIFQVKAGGVIPDAGSVRVRSASGATTALTLKPREGEPETFEAELGRVMEDFEYEIFLGDAFTDPQKVTLVPLPVVKIDFDVRIPEYAAKLFAEKNAENTAKSALEGSEVIAKLSSDKGLKSATFSADEGETKKPMEFKGAGYQVGLGKLESSIRWEAQVVDSDGFSLERPVSGVFQVQPDLPPRVGIAAASRLIWPGASPTVRFKTLDDYALSEVKALLSIQRQSGGETESNATIGEKTVEIAKAEKRELELAGQHKLNLAELKLAEGDRLTVVFQATDYRGESPGKTALSEPLVLEVSDKESVIAALMDLDTEIEQKLDQIINAQLGISGGF